MTKRLIIYWLALMIILSLPLDATCRERGPLTFSEIETLLKSGVISSTVVSKKVAKYGVDFHLTMEQEARLRDLGSDDVLIASIKGMYVSPVKHEAAPAPRVPSLQAPKPPPQPPAAGSLLVKCVPDGADVIVDGMFRGAAGERIGSLKPGDVRVMVRRDGFKDYEGTVRIRAGETATENVTLAKKGPPPGSQPAGAEGGDETAKAAVRPSQKQGTALGGKTGAKNKKGKSRATGSVFVMTAPSGAKVYVKGVYKGTTPVKIDVEVGEYTIVLVRDFYKVAKIQGNVCEGKSQTAGINLVPE